MSAFLGPIHYWLYNKIKFQDNLTKEIVRKHGNESIRSELKEKAGSLQEGSLETIIDESNIHGWLQEQIHLVEKRFAYAVTLCLKEAVSLTDIRQTALNYAAQVSELGPETTVSDAYKYLNDYLLDGMPCDHINQIVADSEQFLSYTRAKNIHASYWEECGGTAHQYDEIRNAIVIGFLANTRIGYEQESDMTFHLFRTID